MEREKKLGQVYQFCSSCSSCPIALESDINGKSGLEIIDDFGGSVKMTDNNLKDLKNFLDKRFSQK